MYENICDADVPFTPSSGSHSVVNGVDISNTSLCS